MLKKYFSLHNQLLLSSKGEIFDYRQIEGKNAKKQHKISNLIKILQQLLLGVVFSFGLDKIYL